MRSTLNDNTLTLFLEGRIDTNNAAALEAEIRAAVSAAPGADLVLDADGLDYISSAGLRVLMKLRKQAGKPLPVLNVSPEVYEIFEVTGFTELLDVRKRMRALSVEGCPVIGRGALGTVYRIDDETIVKVYSSPEYLPLIQVERQRARQAFIKGIPTAISYDIVRVGDSYGSVFELLRARSLNDTIIEHPEQTEAVLRDYVAMIRHLHSVEAQPGELPDARATFLDCVEGLKDVLPPDLAERLRELLQKMPEDRHLVHGDIQMKNVMFSGDELILIDMETLGVGNPVFDLQSLFLTYRAFNEDDPADSMSFFGISDEQCAAMMERILDLYFEDRPPEQRRSAWDKLRILGYLRFLDRIVIHNMTTPELKAVRIRHSLEHLRELLFAVDTLEI